MVYSENRKLIHKLNDFLFIHSNLCLATANHKLIKVGKIYLYISMISNVEVESNRICQSSKFNAHLSFKYHMLETQLNGLKTSIDVIITLNS